MNKGGNSGRVGGDDASYRLGDLGRPGWPDRSFPVRPLAGRGPGRPPAGV